MFKRICLGVLAAVILLGSNCPPNNSGNNTLVPRDWAQVYSDKENSSFNAVHTLPAVVTLRKWQTQVGPLAFSAPVIGPDGTIYIGNANGEIVQLNVNGVERFRRKLATSILSTPAVNLDTNEIFVLAQDPLPAGSTNVTSKLYRLDSGFGLHTISQAISSTAAPKLWSNFVFVPSSGGRLFVFDQLSLTEVGHVDGDACFNLVCGVSDLNLGIGTFLDCLINGAASCVGSVTPPTGPVLNPSVAIVDAAGLVDDPAKPTIIMVGPQCANAFRFFPAGDAPQSSTMPDRHFQLLWSHALVPVDCDFKNIRATTPAAILGGLVVFSTTEQNSALSTVIALDLFTGQEVWHQGLNTIQGPVSAALRQIYVATNSYLSVLDSNGVVVGYSGLQGVGENVALGLDKLYVTSDRGVHTFDIPVTSGGFVFDATGTTGLGVAMAFPVIASDGTVYVTTRDGLLVAYGSSSIQSLALSFPVVTWQSPTDGATLPSAAGQSLVVNVAGASGAAFNGTVTFSSDLDGVLCNAVPAGASATCVTPKPLTGGTHKLTAVATDTTGASFSATIAVQVANMPPTVTITAPTPNATFQQGNAITFTATVSDPDQASFPASSVVWQSNIDGNIGTGLTFMRMLTVGTHTITATATDAAGATGSATVSIQVAPGPVVTIQQPTQGSILFSGSPIAFSATVSDPLEPSFPASGIQWQSSVDGNLGTGPTVSHALSNGSHTISVTATDTHGLTGHASVNVTVQAPVQ